MNPDVQQLGSSAKAARPKSIDDLNCATASVIARYEGRLLKFARRAHWPRLLMDPQDLVQETFTRMLNSCPIEHIVANYREFLDRPPDSPPDFPGPLWAWLSKTALHIAYEWKRLAYRDKQINDALQVLQSISDESLPPRLDARHDVHQHSQPLESSWARQIAESFLESLSPFQRCALLSKSFQKKPIERFLAAADLPPHDEFINMRCATAVIAAFFDTTQGNVRSERRRLLKRLKTRLGLEARDESKEADHAD